MEVPVNALSMTASIERRVGSVATTYSTTILVQSRQPDEIQVMLSMAWAITKKKALQTNNHDESRHL